MSWDPGRSPAELKNVLASFDREQVARLVQDFIEHLHHRVEPYPEQDAHRVLTSLRRKRRFDLMCSAADALIQSGNGTLQIRQDYVQALLDLGMLTAAQAVLEPLIRDSEQAAANPKLPIEEHRRAARVHTEARGLLGRFYKQWYVNADAPEVARNAAALSSAVTAYFSTYSERPDDRERRWHGVNAVALALRAGADKLQLALGFDPEELAQGLVNAVRAEADDGRVELWDLAIAMEASLALGEKGDPVRWAQHYIANTELDAFEVASTLRQLAEVWRFLPDDSLRIELLSLLEARLLHLAGGQVTLDAGEAGIDQRRRAGLQRGSAAGSKHTERYLLGLERAPSIARIDAHDFVGAGTGVLIRGGDLCPALGDERLLLTNAHVTAQEPAPWQYAVRASRARVSLLFGRTPGQEPFRTTVREVVWQSGPSALDACLLRLHELPDQLAPCPIARHEPAKALQGQSVFIAGYPRGASLQFEFTDNVVVDGDERVLHYRAETNKGSSGSPVFDERFRLVALHHEGHILRGRLSVPGFHEASEGVRISAIAAALSQDLASR